MRPFCVGSRVETRLYLEWRLPLLLWVVLSSSFSSFAVPRASVASDNLARHASLLEEEGWGEAFDMDGTRSAILPVRAGQEDLAWLHLRCFVVLSIRISFFGVLPALFASFDNPSKLHYHTGPRDFDTRWVREWRFISKPRGASIHNLLRTGTYCVRTGGKLVWNRWRYVVRTAGSSLYWWKSNSEHIAPLNPGFAER